MNIKQVRIRAVGKMIAELRDGMYVDENCSAVVTCTDKVICSPEISRIPHCCVQFVDTEDPKAQNAFTREQAGLIRDFVTGLDDRVTTLFCCCDWGQSRSSGLAAACMAYLNQDADAVFDNSCYSPNLLVYSYMCEAFGLGFPEEQELRKLWKRRKRAVESLGLPGMTPVRRTRFKRIVLIGNANLFIISSYQPDGEKTVRKDPDWSVILEERLSCPIVNRMKEGKPIPRTGKELAADRSAIGDIRMTDLVVMMFGVNSLLANTLEQQEQFLAVNEASEILRKYLLWMKYVCPGVDLLLVSPAGIDTVVPSMQDQWEEISSRYRAVAEELKIRCLDSQNWEEHLAGENCHAPSGEINKRFSEFLAASIESLGI